MIHSFFSEIAKEFGIFEAVIINDFWFWIETNRANEVHFHEGRYWTFHSIKALQDIYPFATKKKIEYAINSLVEKGVLIKSNFNTQRYDRTTWYAFTDFGESILQKQEIHFPKLGNPFPKNGKSIDITNNICKSIDSNVLDNTIDNNIDNIYINNINNKNNNNNKDIYKREKEIPKEKEKRFVKPTVQEIAAYCNERNNHIDPESFFDFYESKGWKVGQTPMKDWRAAVRQWERRRKTDPKKDTTYLQNYDDLDEIF